MLSRLKFDISPIFEAIYNEVIPEWVFLSTETTFADIQAAGLQSILPIINKLRYYGHSENNIRSRVFVFTENEVYFNYVMAKYKNLPITIKVYNEKIKMKFDVVVGNPPYQVSEEKRGINGGSNKKLWMKFLYLSLDLLKQNGFLAILVPNSWAAGAKNPHTKENIFQDIIRKKNILQIQMDLSEYFNVGIGISSIVLQNTERKSKTIKVEGTQIAIDNFDMLPKKINENLISVLEKINTFPKLNFEFVRIEIKGDKLSSEFSNNYPYKVFLGKSGIKFTNKTTKYDNKPKILIHRIGYGDGNLKTCLDATGEITPSYSNVILNDNIDELQKIDKLLKTPFYNFLYNLFKYTQYNESRALSQLPNINLSSEINDGEIFKVLNLTKDEIESIRILY